MRRVEVVAYAGSRGEEEPRRFVLHDVPVEVERVLESWREPHGRHFRVLAQDDRRYHLLCREPDLSWWLVDDVAAPA